MADDNESYMWIDNMKWQAKLPLRYGRDASQRYCEPHTFVLNPLGRDLHGDPLSEPAGSVTQAVCSLSPFCVIPLYLSLIFFHPLLQLTLQSFSFKDWKDLIDTGNLCKWDLELQAAKKRSFINHTVNSKFCLGAAPHIMTWGPYPTSSPAAP